MRACMLCKTYFTEEKVWAEKRRNMIELVVKSKLEKGVTLCGKDNYCWMDYNMYIVLLHRNDDENIMRSQFNMR